MPNQSRVVALLLIKESIVDRLRDGGEKHGEGFVCWLCAVLAANSPDVAE